MSYNPYDPYNFNGYLPTETFNYTRNQPLNRLMSRPEILPMDYREYTNNQQMDQIYYHGNDQRGYNRQQQILYAPQRRAYDIYERREYPADQVTARIRLSHQRYMSADLISELRRSSGWDVTFQGGLDITVTGHPEGGDGRNEFLREVRRIFRDPHARLC